MPKCVLSGSCGPMVSRGALPGRDSTRRKGRNPELGRRHGGSQLQGDPTSRVTLVLIDVLFVHPEKLAAFVLHLDQAAETVGGVLIFQ